MNLGLSHLRKLGPVALGCGIAAAAPASVLASCSLCDTFAPTFPVLSHELKAQEDSADDAEDGTAPDLPLIEEPRRSAAPS